MAEFIPFDRNVEVNGQGVLSMVNGVHELFRDKMFEIMSRFGIVNPQIDMWYPQEKWLKAFSEIAEKIGDNTLFAIGKSIPDNAIFPAEIDCLKKALESIDVAYHLNHRGGEIGYYKLVSYNEQTKEAVMECKTPYP